jgi:hypothetical protein
MRSIPPPAASEEYVTRRGRSSWVTSHLLSRF